MLLVFRLLVLLSSSSLLLLLLFLLLRAPHKNAELLRPDTKSTRKPFRLLLLLLPLPEKFEFNGPSLRPGLGLKLFQLLRLCFKNKCQGAF